MENKNVSIELTKIAESVSVDKMNEVQTVLNHVFNGVAKMRDQLESIHVVDENDKTNMKLANTIRLGVRKLRLDAEKTFDDKRKEVQTAMLAYKTEDQLWLKAKQIMMISTKEIEEIARQKEETAERIAKERHELKIKERTQKIEQLGIFIEVEQFANLTDEMFDMFLNGIKADLKAKHEAEQKRIEDERRAIEEQKKEQERIRIENEKLRLEQEKMQKELEAERIRMEKEKQAAELKAKQEREKLEAEFKAKADAEKKAREQAEQELKKIQDAEKKAKELEAKKAKAPDKTKLMDFAKQIGSMKIDGLKSDDAIKIHASSLELLAKVQKYITEKCESLL